MDDNTQKNTNDFRKKQGLNLFLGLVENANSLIAVPTAEEYRSAYSMLLNKGSICLEIDILAAALKSL
ncbi:hypothetical protein SAMN05421755_106511 [Nitrosomonas sp. Nm33]|nr:hypothetical protein SAMN05421755_106511 [Nitrosomonas sp. Nm33]